MKKKLNDLLIIAHMGGTGKFIGNSQASLQDCWSQKIWPELDIRVTLDKKLAIIHDESTKSTCEGSHEHIVKETSSKNLKKLRLCTGDGGNYQIPFLEDIANKMKVCKGRQVLLDVKDNQAFDLIKKLVKQYDIGSQVHFFSADFEKCKVIKKVFPESKIIYNFRTVKDFKLKWLKDNDIYTFLYCSPEGKIDAVLKNIKESGLKQLCNEAKKHKRKFGAIILEDFPEKLLREYLDAGFDTFGVENIQEFRKTFDKR